MANRCIILDTETTGLSPKQGHRIIEIGCVEIINRQLTGEHFHVYIDPMRDVDEGAKRVHGLDEAFLRGKPKFSDIYKDFEAFVRGDEMIIHNAPFDIGFLQSEYTHLGQAWPFSSNTITDSLMLARRKHPGQKNNLDALCKRYHINNEQRTLHGALLDSEILAEVYLSMTGGQSSLSFEPVALAPIKAAKSEGKASINTCEIHTALKVLKANNEEIKAHKAIVHTLSENDLPPLQWEL